MKATAIAPANIAFIKYWGKVDPKTRIPNNSSISMNLSQMFTTTTVEFNSKFKSDSILFVNEVTVKEKEITRIIEALEKIRSKTGIKYFAKVATKNSFPKATGIASSASGFASLALASFGALGKNYQEKELSVFCRTLSGTACRSIPDGFVEWTKGNKSENSFAYQLHPQNYWNICDVIVVVSKTMKKVGSTEGHAISDTSPFYKQRLQNMDKKLTGIKKAMKNKDFSTFGQILEREALNMHAICITSTPSLLYWEPATLTLMKNIINWREAKDIESYFTIDAGPSVHIICLEKDASEIANRVRKLTGVLNVIVNKPGKGAYLTDIHLF